MNARSVVLGVGTAVTTFLLVGAVTIESMGGGEAPAIGIVGVLVGFVAGVIAGVAVGAFGDSLSGTATTVLVGYATFGVAVVAIAGTSYLNVPGADDVFTFPVHIGTSLVAAVVVALLDRQLHLEA